MKTCRGRTLINDPPPAGYTYCANTFALWTHHDRLRRGLRSHPAVVARPLAYRDVFLFLRHDAATLRFGERFALSPSCVRNCRAVMIRVR